MHNGMGGSGSFLFYRRCLVLKEELEERKGKRMVINGQLIHLFIIRSKEI